jgi:3-oxoacyl-[acyl-carrier-protein] synthase III
MIRTCLTGSGLYTPPGVISNDALVASYNAWAQAENARAAEAIAAGQQTPVPLSSSEFIVKASGIRSRHAVDPAGVLDPERMRPWIRRRSEDEPSLMCEMGLTAARQALARAGREASEVDAVFVACSNLQRPYPAIAVELQAALGAGGYAFDLNVACASAAFGIQTAVQAVAAGSARAALVVSPEICTGHLNFRNRDCHFIFGDAATAVLIEPMERAQGEAAFEVLGTRLLTKYSNNIRNDFGFLNECEQPGRAWDERLFRQEGRKVFKEVVPIAAELILGQLADLGLSAADLKRLWLHQANLSMNQLIARRVLGREATLDEAPVILDEYGNTSSAGSIIAFHLHHDDLRLAATPACCAPSAPAIRPARRAAPPVVTDLSPLST